MWSMCYTFKLYYLHSKKSFFILKRFKINKILSLFMLPLLVLFILLWIFIFTKLGIDFHIQFMIGNLSSFLFYVSTYMYACVCACPCVWFLSATPTIVWQLYNARNQTWGPVIAKIVIQSFKQFPGPSHPNFYSFVCNIFLFCFAHSLAVLHLFLWLRHNQQFQRNYSVLGLAS